MNKIKIISLVLMFVLSLNSAQAKKIKLDDLIKKSGLDKTGTVAVSVRDAKSGAVEYEYNQDKLLHPCLKYRELL